MSKRMEFLRRGLKVEMGFSDDIFKCHTNQKIFRKTTICCWDCLRL